MWAWLMIIANMTATVISVMVINRGITDSCLDDISLGLVLLVANLICLAINIYRKVK